MSGNDVDRLRMVSIFAGLSDVEIGHVAAMAAPFEVEGGHVLVEPNQPGSGMFVITEGAVDVQLPDGSHVSLGPGEFVGELSILAEIARTARVRAVGPVRGFAIARAAFQDLLHEQPAIAVAMLSTLARRLADLESRLG
jgi:CRP-like cAMP-binding protein